MRKLILSACLMAAILIPAAAQSLPPEVKQAVQNYKLDVAKANRICDALADLTANMLKDPKWQQKLMASMKLPFDQQLKQMESDPASAAILKKNGLDARDYTIGLFALRGAVFSLKGMNVEIAKLTSPANIALVKANPALLAKFEKADSGQR